MVYCSFEAQVYLLSVGFMFFFFFLIIIVSDKKILAK